MDKKKSLGVTVRFIDGHEERYEGVEIVEWGKLVVFLGKYITKKITVNECKTKLFSRKVTVVQRKIKDVEIEYIAQFKHEHVIGVVDYYV